MGKKNHKKAWLTILSYCHKKPLFSLQEAVMELDIYRGTITKYMKILEQAGWFHTFKEGKEVHYIMIYKSPQAFYDFINKEETEKET